jgi:cytochrome c oxidase subunit 2
MDVIPGLTNVTWIEASTPGVFLGQCAEFCGLEHARMALRVVAEPPTEFRGWAARQAAAPAPTRSPLASAGSDIFVARCASCHTVSGTSAGGIVGPELSHLASRSTLAAGTLPNDSRSLAAWIKDPQAIKPGAKMPSVALSTSQRAQVVAYLQSLS